jgi:hypothetical protein
MVLYNMNIFLLTKADEEEVVRALVAQPSLHVTQYASQTTLHSPISCLLSSPK